MSKGNMFMGQARGKVGSVVFARSKGQQITRAYNEKPNNPRTARQMTQRSVFMSAVKFYTRGRQAFFQFAFENKNEKESDYNAFMRENAKVGPNLSKAAFDEATYPSIAPYMMTKGSLPELDATLNAGKTAFELSATGLATTATVGQLSASLIDTYGLQSGDIFTICIITANGTNAENTPSVDPEKRGAIKWDIKQIILNPASTATIAETLGSEVTAAAGALVITPSQMATSACSVSVTVSRDTTEGLKVSNTYLNLNDIANTIYEASKDENYIEDVLTSWKSSGEAILQGSLVQ